MAKEEITDYFNDLINDYFDNNNCNSCPFTKECSILMYDSDWYLCKYITTYDN